MREFSYRLKNGMPDEVEHVIYIYTSAGWEFKELLPADGIPQQIVLKGITKLTDGQQIKPITLERYNQKIAEAAKLAESQDNAHAFATAMGGKK